MPRLTRRTAAVELASGEVLTVRIINPDTLRYEQTAQRHGWPTLTVQDGVAHLPDQSRKATFEVWAALRRTGQYAGTWEDFEGGDCVEVAVDEEQVDPTRPAPGSDSSQSSPGSAAGTSPSSPEPTMSS